MRRSSNNNQQKDPGPGWTLVTAHPRPLQLPPLLAVSHFVSHRTSKSYPVAEGSFQARGGPGGRPGAPASSPKVLHDDASVIPYWRRGTGLDSKWPLAPLWSARAYVFGRFAIGDGRISHRRLTALGRKVVFEEGCSKSASCGDWRPWCRSFLALSPMGATAWDLPAAINKEKDYE